MGTMHNRSCRSRNIQRNSSLRSNYKFLREHWCILNNLDLRDKVRNKGHEELILVYVYHLRGPEGGGPWNIGTHPIELDTFYFLCRCLHTS